jgi:hypothetical protein
MLWSCPHKRRKKTGKQNPHRYSSDLPCLSCRRYPLVKKRWVPSVTSTTLFVWLVNQTAVLFSQNKPATNNQPAVLFALNKSAPVISHQPNEHAVHLQILVPLPKFWAAATSGAEDCRLWGRRRVRACMPSLWPPAARGGTDCRSCGGNERHVCESVRYSCWKF